MGNSYREVANGVYNRKTDSLEPRKKEVKNIEKEVNESNGKRKWLELLFKINSLRSIK